MANVKRPRKDPDDNSSFSNSSGSDELSYDDDDNESSSSVESGLVSADSVCIMRASPVIQAIELLTALEL